MKQPILPLPSRAGVNCGNTNKMNMSPSQLDGKLSNCEVARKKKSFFGASTGLHPYTRSWPIYWVHQPVKGMKHQIKLCELREYKWNEYVTIAVELQFKQLRNSPFSGLLRNCFNCDLTAMVTYLFQLYLPQYFVRFPERLLLKISILIWWPSDEMEPSGAV